MNVAIIGFGIMGKEVEKILLQNEDSFDNLDIKHKVYTSLSLLIYNLDETSQKS